MEEVDDARELVFGPDRKLDRNAAVGELGARGFEDAVEVGALAVEHVDEDDARELVLLGALPDAARVDLHPHDAAEHDDDALDDSQRRVRVGLEAGVAGSVDEVDLAVVPLEVAERARQRHDALLLVLVPVGNGRALLDRPEPVRLSRLEEQRLDERGFPDAAMSCDGDVPDLGRLGGSHTGRVLLVDSGSHRIPERVIGTRLAFADTGGGPQANPPGGFMTRTVMLVLAALASLVAAASALGSASPTGAATPSLKVQPGAVKPGGRVHVFGNAGSCAAGSKLTALSFPFPESAAGPGTL